MNDDEVEVEDCRPVDDDLQAIMHCVVDLAFYRRSLPVADDLAYAAAHELRARVAALPEVLRGD